MPHQPQLIPDEPMPEQAARNAERAAYLEKLRQKLQEPEFRNIEGFPLAEDEAILALSDPPYYTACPNPFLPEIIERWQAERDEIQSADDSSSPAERERGPGGEGYHREPFAADVSEGKNDPIYNAHSYHTKVPHKAIMRYILHYTEPGDLVFDGFCGTGMTGVAAQLCGDKKTVESLGYYVDNNGNIYQNLPSPGGRGAGGEGQASISRLGARKAVLCDLSPAATFIAYNYNTPVDVKAFAREAERILQEVEDECGWMYKTVDSDTQTELEVYHYVWSEVLLCSECSTELRFWDIAVEEGTGKIKSEFTCTKCRAILNKRNLDRSQETLYDADRGQVVKQAKHSLSQIKYLLGNSRGPKYSHKNPDKSDLDLVSRITEEQIPYWFPVTRIDRDIDMWYERDYRSLGIFSIDQFFTKRNLWILSTLWEKTKDIASSRVAQAWKFAVTGMQVNLSKMNRWRANVSFPYNPLSGTLYVGALPVESNVIIGIRNKVNRLEKIWSGLKLAGEPVVTTQSTTYLSHLKDECCDYIFTDPPFGSNIIYSDLSIIWESWLQASTNTNREAVVHRRKKDSPSTLENYLVLMARCFGEMYRILKSGHWMTVEFHNSQNAVWNAIQEAILRAGFMVADVRVLDKQLGSFKQVTASGAVKQDLVISAYKPRTDFEQQFLQDGGRVKGVWEFVSQHLEQLPAVVQRPSPARGGVGGGVALEVVAERQAYLLYDRMVAFHIQRGFSVPLSAAEFYAGLKQRFPERDGMYFLPAQAAEYDKHRLRASRLEQLALFVTDEKSAIQWLNRELNPDTGGGATGSGPQTYQDLQPKFLRELHQARHEKLPELRDILEENFIQDDRERWEVPNPERLEHMEQLRERSLLREFQAYAGGKGRLKIFRTEAVRAGFKRAWANQDYRLIVTVAQRLPESVLQEDPGLLMYYDNALMRVEKEPVQGRLL